MKKTKKMMALALAASMVLGSSTVAFAADGDPTPGGTVNVSGSGSVEGHVNKEVLNVVLPTVPSGTPSAFAYTMDPERLIQGTDAAKYAEVYFLQQILIRECISLRTLIHTPTQAISTRWSIRAAVPWILLLK